MNTNKIDLIKAEVVRMHNLLPVMDGDNISVNYADRICTTLEMYIDSLQEEPVSEDKDLEETINAIKLLTSNTALLTFEYGFRKGAKWQKEQDKKWLAENHKHIFAKGKESMIAKACDWLKENITYTHPRKGTTECIVNLTAFKEAMEE